MNQENEDFLGKAKMSLSDKVIDVFARAGETRDYSPTFQGTLGQKLAGWGLYLSLISGLFYGAHALGKTETKDVQEETFAKSPDLKPIDLQKLVENFYVPETAPKPASKKIQSYATLVKDQKLNFAALKSQEPKPVSESYESKCADPNQSDLFDRKLNQYFLSLGTTPNLSGLFPKSEEYYQMYTDPKTNSFADMEQRLKNTKQYDRIIRKAANESGVPANLLYGLIMIESAGSNDAGSSAGAKGLMQLMPGTAKDLKCPHRKSPEESIPCGAKYLASIVRHFKKKLPDWSEQDIWALSLRGYNQGENGAWKYLKAVMPIKSFDEFVAKRHGEDGSYDYAYQIMAIQRMLDEKDGFKDQIMMSRN